MRSAAAVVEAVSITGLGADGVGGTSCGAAASEGTEVVEGTCSTTGAGAGILNSVIASLLADI